MLCCATLRTLLRHRQTLLVRARHLGKKWVLRACGRALFSEVARHFEAGVAHFVFPGPAENWEPFLELARRVAGDGPRLFRDSTRLIRACANPDPPLPDEEIHPGCLFYLGTLAESRGFKIVAGIFATVWHRGSVAFWRVVRRGEMDRLLKAAHAYLNLNSTAPDFGFRPMEMFAGDSFFPEEAFLAEVQKLDPMGFSGQEGHPLLPDECQALLRFGLGNVARDLLGAELRTTVFFVKFLQKVHYPHSLQDFEGDVPSVVQLCKIFEHVLDIRME